MELLLAPFLVFIALPPAAFVPSVFFAWLWHATRLKSLVVAALLWGVYGLYECAIWVWSQDATAPIRVELLAVAPVLYVASLVALVAWWQRPY